MYTYTEKAEKEMTKDEQYLIKAANSYVSITCPRARFSLQKLGFVVPCFVRGSYNSTVPHAMCLTKKGQKRVDQIIKLMKVSLEYCYKRGPKYQWKT